MTIRNDLAHFYDEQAKYWEVTRRKHRPEFDYVFEQIESHPSDEIRIVELGCGDGRLCRGLEQRSNKKIKYTGVDISKGLLDIAREKGPKHERIEAAMEEYVTECDQESVDFFISVASFHHLPDQKSRLLTLVNIYRALKYGGQHISFNWAFSQWFRKKMKRPIIYAWMLHIATFGRKNKRDIMVPFYTPDKKEKFTRYYHLFDLEELEYLTRKAGFITRELCYIATNGEKTQDRSHARNSLLVQEKNVSEEEEYQRK